MGPKKEKKGKKTKEKKGEVTTTLWDDKEPDPSYGCV